MLNTSDPLHALPLNHLLLLLMHYRWCGAAAGFRGENSTREEWTDRARLMNKRNRIHDKSLLCDHARLCICVSAVSAPNRINFRIHFINLIFARQIWPPDVWCEPAALRYLINYYIYRYDLIKKSRSDYNMLECHASTSIREKLPHILAAVGILFEYTFFGDVAWHGMC